MFYGSGAGKLPTASAVVSDVVDCAKHLHRNVMVNWSNHRLELMNVDEVRNRFFVRVSGTPAQRKEEVEKLFGPVDIVTVPGLPDEFAFVTGMITERSFRERAEQIDGILSRIRARI